MKKTTFIYDLRQSIEGESIDSLKKLVLNIANYIPKESYEKILLMFEKNEEIIEDNGNSDMDLLNATREVCLAIEDGQYELSWEEYDDYGNWADYEHLSDKDALGAELENLFETTISYVIDEKYSEALQAFDLLFSIEVPTEWDDITVYTLFLNEIIHLDMEEAMVYYAYTILMVLHDDKRIEELFRLEQFANYKLKICEIVKVGIGEIPEQEKFIKQWKEYLMKQNLLHKEHILIDAVIFEGGVQTLKDFVQKHGTQFETSYIELIKMYMNDKQYDNATLIATNALEKLNGVNSNRAKVADLLLEVGQIIKVDKFVETGIIEGFYSSLDLKHFLQLYRLNKQNVITEAIKCLEDKTQNPNTDYYYIHFLNGDYELVLTDCIKDKQSLGWSSSIKGKMLPLFIVLLANEVSLTPCTKKLINNTFHYDSIPESFFEVLILTLRKLSDNDYKKYFDWCLKEIVARAEAIIQGQYRGSYHKVSTLIVAMAEVLKVQKDEESAIQFIKEYKEKYPRHIAFHGCLREDINLSNFDKIF